MRKCTGPVSFLYVRCVAALVAAAVLPYAGFAAEPDLSLTSVASVRALTPSQASQQRPVVLRGVVTGLSGWKSSFFFQDQTAGISVNRDFDTPQLRQGQQVEVRGVTDEGGFAPSIQARSVRILGPGTLPPARVFTAAQLAGGAQDSQWMAVRGIVRSADVKPSWGRSVLFLNLDIGNGTIVMARVYDFLPELVDTLISATVTVRGVCGSAFNDKRQFEGSRLFVQSMDDIKIERPARKNPFDLPVSSPGSLLRFGDEHGSIEPAKVQGVVTWFRRNEGEYIQAGQDGMFIQDLHASAPPVGSLLEAVGYPAVGRSSPQLDNAISRVIGPGRPPEPLSKAPSEMIVIRNTFPYAPFDSVLVKTTGILIQEVPGAEENLLLLQDGPTVFTARLPRTAGNRKTLTGGSFLSVTGICRANDNEAHEARSFEILLRSADDIVILRRAPWWTAAHAGWIVAALAAMLLVMSAWLAITKRQAHLRALAVTDPLTGVYNRRGFHLLGQQQWQLAIRRKIPVLLFFIDLDDFKEINDTYGHKTGDLTLHTVARVLRESFRSTDIVGRLGGDEFAVFALDAPPSSQELLQLRIKAALRHANESEQRSFKISLSIGVLVCEPSMGALSIEELLERADFLMYEQKRRHKSDAGPSDAGDPNAP